MTKSADDLLKNALRKLIKKQHWDESEMGALAKDFICDTHQTGTFLDYLNQRLEDGEI